MQSSPENGEDIFFDSFDHARISSDSASTDDSVVEASDLGLMKDMYEIWTDELVSISERRERFLREMGFIKSLPSQLCDSPEIKDGSCRLSAEPLGLDRITEGSGAELDSFSSVVDGPDWDLDCCIRDLDSGKKFLVHKLGQDGLPCFLKEVGSDRLITLQEFEKTLGLSCSVQKLFRREGTCSGEIDDTLIGRKKKSRRWWKGFAMKNSTVNSKVPRTMRTRVQHCGKRYMEFSAVYMGQEIQGHKGSILTMKFSPDGHYLATGGEDCVVRVWSVVEVDASCKHLAASNSPISVDRIKGSKLLMPKRKNPPRSAPVILPKSIFKIEDKPSHEFHGHTNDILDLSWSKSNYLLSSSKDKTVCMWRVGCDGCFQVFQHSNYVTCIQCNPIDDDYFITGSIDGKVRIWGIPDHQVVDWIDVRDIVTAVSYRPDGQGFVVGSITGSCRYYDSSGNNMRLEKQIFIQGKKKSPGKRITGFQFTPDDLQKLMITSADSKVRIVDGVNVIHKFRGLRNSRCQLSASFTEDGRYIVSVGDDSHIYIWNYHGRSPLSSKGLKSVRSCEHFFSEGASVAIPWPGIDHKQRGIHNPCTYQNQKGLDRYVIRDLDRFSRGGWLFADCPKVSSVTWPEEKLPIWAEAVEDISQHGRHNHHLQLPSASWSRVIVVAGRDGSIRTYHNYGLPVRL